MSGDTATLRHQRCATIVRALRRAREELRIAWDEAYTDLNEPERDDELSNFCRDTIAKLQPLMLKAHEAMVRNRNAALGLSLPPVHHADLGAGRTQEVHYRVMRIGDPSPACKAPGIPPLTDDRADVTCSTCQRLW